MKLCQNCGQAVAEPINNCPSCGTEVAEGLKYVDDYRILDVVYEGRSSMVCRAIKDGEDTPVALRLFTADSGVDEKVAARLKNELEQLQKLPKDWFVQHYSIQCSSQGLWYRISEWLEAESWGDLFSSSRLRDLDVAYDLFYRLAAILDGLHKSGHFIPHLILNDILVLKGKPDRVDVKIDYKLSRFLDPKMAKPVPLLQNLLNCHPDIRAGNPLNFKSDIWSLGRIFTQILTADLELCDPTFAAKSETLPKEIAILIRSMLTAEPDLRPRSMSEVAEALQRIRTEHIQRKKNRRKGTLGEIRKLKKTIVAFGVIIVIMAAAGSFFMLRLGRSPTDLESVFANYADLYAKSIAFVVVNYQIEADEEILYQQRTEGTAFLVDNDGYLLTNRHVACPWLEDQDMLRVIRYLQGSEKQPRFTYRMYLWFEGETAFNRLLGIGKEEEIEDVYNIFSAFSNDGTPGVEIAGVARASARTEQIVKAPLRDDFAVLKINPVPQDLQPLPLDRNLDTTKLKRLSPVMALGFPLGRSSQAEAINVSVTRGHVRRTFDSFFQVDTSIYRGNSGGPIIDEYGRVIGIASAVATDVAVAPLPVITHLSDMGLVLPITKAAVFIDELKTGKNKWNGAIDLSASAKIQEITAAAYAGKWSEAVELAERNVQVSETPELILAAAMIEYCVGDLETSRRLFHQVISINPENYQARLMLCLIDRREGKMGKSIHLKPLLQMNWLSPGEFFGHLARELNSSGHSESLLDSWNNPAEKGWVYYIAGLKQMENKNPAKAQFLFKTAALASASDEWPLYLALAELSRQARAKSTATPAYPEIMKEVEAENQKRKERAEKTSELFAEFERTAADQATRRDLLLKLYLLEPENKKLLAFATFSSAMISEWPQALDTGEKFLQLQGREDPLRLGVRLLVPGILNQMGENEEAVNRLNAYITATETPWYLQLYHTLLNQQNAEELISQAENIPEKILTAYTTLGFRAEAGGDESLAAKYYREALGSYLDNWPEYELARQRYLRLRQTGRK